MSLPTCPLSEMLLYQKVSFGTKRLSTIRNTEVVHYSGAENVLSLQEYIEVGTSMVVFIQRRSAIGRVRYRRFHVVSSES